MVRESTAEVELFASEVSKVTGNVPPGEYVVHVVLPSASVEESNRQSGSACLPGVGVGGVTYPYVVVAPEMSVLDVRTPPLQSH